MKNLTDFSKTVENGMDSRLQRRSFLSLSKLGRGPQDFDSKGSLPTFCQISEIKTFSNVLHGLEIKTLMKMAGESTTRRNCYVQEDLFQ